MIIDRVMTFDEADFAHILEDGQAQGYWFVHKFIEEYRNGANRFDKPGETLFSVMVDGKVVGIGGLNLDPYLNQYDVGRVRHLYIHSNYRGHGTGKKLLEVIIEAAKGRFTRLTVYTDNPIADKLYRDCGFKKVDTLYKESHVLELNEIAV